MPGAVIAANPVNRARPKLEMPVSSPEVRLFGLRVIPLGAKPR